MKNNTIPNSRNSNSKNNRAVNKIKNKINQQDAKNRETRRTMKNKMEPISDKRLQRQWKTKTNENLQVSKNDILSSRDGVPIYELPVNEAYDAIVASCQKFTTKNGNERICLDLKLKDGRLFKAYHPYPFYANSPLLTALEELEATSEDGVVTTQSFVGLHVQFSTTFNEYLGKPICNLYDFIIVWDESDTSSDSEDIDNTDGDDIDDSSGNDEDNDDDDDDDDADDNDDESDEFDDDDDDMNSFFNSDDDDF